MEKEIKITNNNNNNNQNIKYEKEIANVKNKIDQDIDEEDPANRKGRLSRPVMNIKLERKGNKYMKVGVASMQGFRRTMEDAHSLVLSLPSEEKRSVFGVFDGHGGSTAAKFCEDNFPNEIEQIKSLSSDQIIDAILRLDEKFISQSESESGCTATFAIIDQLPDKKIKIAIGNVGDSRTMLVRKNGEISFCTRDHKPDDHSEKKRIKKAKGSVFRHRVCGNLAMSRAIGDKEFKENSDLPPTDQIVTAVADVTICTAEEGDYLIICCDGLLESLSTPQLVEFVVRRLEKSDDLAQILKELLLKSLEEGSNDNMTAMIVKFTNGKDYHDPDPNLVQGPFFRGAPDFQEAYVRDLEKNNVI